jgi:hypothetical protein
MRRHFKHIASSAIAKLGNSPLLGAVVATKECAIFFKAVSHNPDATCRAGWRESVDGALEAVEGVGLPAFRHLKCLVIIISASFAPGHTHHSYWLTAGKNIKAKPGSEVPIYRIDWPVLPTITSLARPTLPSGRMGDAIWGEQNHDDEQSSSLSAPVSCGFGCIAGLESRRSAAGAIIKIVCASRHAEGRGQLDSCFFRRSSRVRPGARTKRNVTRRD